MMLLCRMLASLKLTMAALFFLAVGVLYAYLTAQHTTLALVLPLLLLSLNLLAAIVSNRVFRKSGPLLVFHLALLSLILLVALGRLSYLKGRVELAQGEEFDGQLTVTEAGPWHLYRLDKIHFVNDGFDIAYDVGLQRGKTSNRVRVLEPGGVERQQEIGDHIPLVQSGYRFYTTPNKGFAPAFLWYPADGGEPVLGTVHLPPYPAHEYEQSSEWQLPGMPLKLWTMLQFDELLLDPDRPTAFRLPHQHKVVVRYGDIRRELQPGDGLDLPGGRLVYQGLRTWMGYTVFYDWTIHWLLLACLVAVGSLGWHFWNKFAARPWNA